MAARTLRLGLRARAAPTGDGASPRPLRARTPRRAWVRTLTLTLTLTLTVTLEKGGSNEASALREAIAVAKEAGVSLVAIRDAENALSKMEARSPQ